MDLLRRDKMNQYIRELTAGEAMKGKGFPFEINVNGETLKMTFYGGDQLFDFCIADNPNDNSSLELINDALVELASTVERQFHRDRSLPDYISEIPFSTKTPPPIGESVLLTTPKKRPNSFFMVTRLAEGWLVRGGGSNHIYLQSLHALLENAKAQSLLLPETTPPTPG